MIEVKPLIQELLPDVEALFNTSRETHGCWCMWFLIPYKEYKAGGPEGNRQQFIDLMAATPFPIGLLAYRQGEVVRWWATGPRSRASRWRWRVVRSSAEAGSWWSWRAMANGI